MQSARFAGGSVFMMKSFFFSPCALPDVPVVTVYAVSRFYHMAILDSRAQAGISGRQLERAVNLFVL